MALCTKTKPEEQTPNTKLMLFLWPDCHRDCPMCANKNFDWSTLPKVDTIKAYDEIILTGGEPLLYPERTYRILQAIRMSNPTAKVWMYSSKMDNTKLLTHFINKLDGVTLTIHPENAVSDFKDFTLLDAYLSQKRLGTRPGLRLKVFAKMNVPYFPNWDITRNCEYTPDCQVPEHFDFCRL